MCRLNDLSVIVCDSDTRDLFRFKNTFNKIGVEDVSFEISPWKLSSRIISRRPDLLLINTALPGQDAFDLGKKVSDICPDILMLFFSPSATKALSSLRTIAMGGVGHIQGTNEHRTEQLLGSWVTVAKNTRNLKEFLYGPRYAQSA